MKWTLGLLLVGLAGCGYHESRMVACPETGCPGTYAAVSPEGTRGPEPGAKPPTKTEVAPAPAP